MNLFTPSLHQNLHQNISKNFVNFLPIKTIRKIFKEGDLDPLNEEKVIEENSEKIGKSNRDLGILKKTIIFAGAQFGFSICNYLDDINKNEKNNPQFRAIFKCFMHTIFIFSQDLRITKRN